MYACARELLRMSDSKGGRISREIQISIAHTGRRFLRGKRYRANLRYAQNRSIPFSRRFARVNLTPFSTTLKLVNRFSTRTPSRAIEGLHFSKKHKKLAVASVVSY